ncbi:hypothetical protein AcV7_007870 [Taiwanofungus camphoratus]|nr:hypothetical protein AcV7_007870 [Antrodia cinnamomea]
MPATRSPIPNANLHDDSVSTHKHTRKHRTVNSLERAYTDVILTIKPFFADLIRKREKDHEFRRYRLRAAVKRLWLYESTPTCAITHVVETTNPKVPGEVRDSDGVGNDAFDAGQLTAFAYPVVGLFKLKFPIGRVELRERFATKSPQGFCYVNKQMLDEVPSSGMERLF